MEEDEEWDVATMLEIDRLEASAVRASQFRTPIASHLDEWDAGAIGMELSRSQLQNAGTMKQEVDRLSAQLRLKDQEILDAKRQSLQKEEHLKEALAVMQRENDELKKKQFDVAVGEKRKREMMAYQVATCTAKTVNSSKPANTPLESPAAEIVKNGVHVSPAERSSSRELTSSVSVDFPEVLQNLHRIWLVGRREAGRELLTRLFTTRQKDLNTLLSAEESEIEHNQNSRAPSENLLCDSLKQVLQGHRSIQSLIAPLTKYLSSQNSSKVRGALRIFHCLAGNTWTIFNRQTDSVNEGWNETNRFPAFSARITSKLKNSSNSDEDQTRKHEEIALSFVKSILQLSQNHSDAAVKQEALCLVASFVVHTNPSQERFRVGAVLLEENLISLLKKDLAAGSSVQIQAVRILHLLFNSPKLLEIICNRTGQLASTLKQAMDGLCSCLTQDDDPVQDYLLRKSALITITYLLTARNESVLNLVQELDDLPNVAKELVSLIDLELRHEELRKNGSSDRASLLPEAVALLFQLGSPLLTKSPEVANRSLTVTNKLVALGSQSSLPRPGRKPFSSTSSMTVVDMAKILRSKILSNSRDSAL